MSTTTSNSNHRTEFRDFVINAADSWHKTYLGRLYEAWADWNLEFFDGAFTDPPIILLAEPSNPRRLGDYGRVSGHGCQTQIRIRPSLLTGTNRSVVPGERFQEGRYLFVQDVCLHEMVHQWQDEIIGVREEAYAGHGTYFRDRCNAIGVKLGLAPVRTCKKRGKESDLPSCSYWPHCVRPPDYYQGAYTPRSEPDTETVVDAEVRRLMRLTTPERNAIFDTLFARDAM